MIENKYSTSLSNSYPPKARTIVMGNDSFQLKRMIFVLSYFIRFYKETFTTGKCYGRKSTEGETTACSKSNVGGPPNQLISIQSCDLLCDSLKQQRSNELYSPQKNDDIVNHPPSKTTNAQSARPNNSTSLEGKVLFTVGAGDENPTTKYITEHIKQPAATKLKEGRPKQKAVLIPLLEDW